MAMTTAQYSFVFGLLGGAGGGLIGAAVDASLKAVGLLHRIIGGRFAATIWRPQGEMGKVRGFSQSPLSPALPHNFLTVARNPALFCYPASRKKTKNTCASFS